MAEEFGGDVYLYDTDNGAEISVVNGLIIPDKGFRSAVYLSLFGGNKEDTGEVINVLTWWGNNIESNFENEKLVSRFQSFINSVSMTSKNLTIAEEKVREDLKWFIDDGIADTVDVNITEVNRKQIEVKIVISKAGQLIESGIFGLQWGSMKDGIRE